MFKFKIDHENNAEKFWYALRENLADAPISEKAREQISPLADMNGPDEVWVSLDESQELIAWLATLPGWNDGPNYAPHPLVWG